MNFDFFIDLLFPRYCLACESGIDDDEVRRSPDQGGAICEACYLKINLNNSLFCGDCGSRLPNNKKICHLDFPYVLGAATIYSERNGLPALTHGLKFKFIKSAAIPMSALMIRYAEALKLFEEPVIIIPVPLSKKRKRERGFNQASIIADRIARHFQKPLLENILIRDKHSSPQSVARSKEERHKNVKDAFIVTTNEQIKGKKIVLIDDVVTSGITLFEAAKMLKTAGAKKILALAVAKA